MKSTSLILLKTALVAIVLQALPANAGEPYPLEYWALREVASNVTVSPDGDQVAMLRILTRSGDPILHIYDADDLDKDPFVVNSDPMEITSYYWADDNFIILTLRQRMRDMVKGQEESVFDYKIAILDVKKKKFDDFDAAYPRVENVLANVPGKIIVSEQPGLEETLTTEQAFRPRAYYEMNLKTGAKKLLIRGKWSLAQISFDADGNPRFGRGYDVGEHDYVFFYRDPGEKKWRDIMRNSDDNFELWHEEVIGFDPAVPGNVLMKSFNGDDKLGLWSYNTNTKTFDELLYRRSDVDIVGARFHSNSWANPDQVTAVSYFKDKYHFEYFDEIEGATFRQLEELIPYAHYVSIPSRSRDGNSLIARNVGPRDPGTYYLYRDGEFKAIASQQPLIDPEELADVKYMTYKARDGKKLATFVTVPNGEPPYPTIVMPHGGPHVQERVLYDEWAQMLANNGYMVVQPQYRMSLGYGFEHFTSAFMDGSEAGRKMQDDKDDATLFLIEEGLADPARVAMYGWSYGGYAALIAGSRTPQLYQCTMAGAAVSDYRRAANEFSRGSKPRGFSLVWRDVYEYGAVQPVDEVDKVNIPVLLIHGSVDSRVLPKQAAVYRDALDEAGKFYKYVELEGADHFYSTLFYEHQIELYESIIDFLNNDCGNISKEMQASASD